MNTTDPAASRLGVVPARAGAQDLRSKHLEVLNEIGRIATSDLELQPMLQRITDALARHFDWQLVALVSLDPDHNSFVCEALTTTVETEVHVGYSRPVGSGVVGQVTATLQPIVVDDVRTFPNFVETTPGVLSEMCAPVIHKGRLVAVLNIESTRLAAFRNDLPLLLTVTDQIGGAIAFARAYEETRQWARLMEMTSEVTRTALEETDLDRLLDRVVWYIHEHFPLEIVTVVLNDRESDEFVQTAAAGEITLVSALRAPVSSGLIGRCITSGQTQLLEDVTREPAYIPLNARVVSELAVPIRCQGEILGALNLESASREVFTSSNVLAFEAFADQVAGAIRLASMKRQLEEANRELRTLSATDALTGLANRRSFDERLTMEWRRAIRARQPLSILFIDVDAFKSFNDLHGHQAGDECLRTIATTLGVALQRSTDFVARYGGEEFAVLLAETDSAKAAAAADIARTTVECLALPHEGSPTGVVTISIGCATVVPVSGMSPADLMQRADEALYEAKRAGRNCVVTR